MEYLPLRLSGDQLIQLTDNSTTDIAPHEWNPLLPVSPQGLVPKRWGRLSLHYRNSENAIHLACPS